MPPLTAGLGLPGGTGERHFASFYMGASEVGSGRTRHEFVSPLRLLTG